MSDEIFEPIKPQVVTEAPEYDSKNPDHVARWVAAGRPDLEALDGDGNKWRPTITTLLQEDGSYLPIMAPGPNPAALMTSYLNARQAEREKTIEGLRGASAAAMVYGLGYDQAETMRLGAEFYRRHITAITAYIGGAANSLLADVQVDEAPWLKAPLPSGGTILALFEAALA